MATIEDAFALAERYAADATVRAGRPYRGLVEEFAHGWCVWTTPQTRDDGPPALGSGATTVLDRGTGLLAFYPAWSNEQIMARYEPASATYRSWPPVARRADVLALLPGPARIAMALTADNVTIAAASARGDAEPAHHPLVAGWLAARPAGELVRGAHRHADLILLSEVFRHAERAGLTETAQVWDWLFDPRPVSYRLSTAVPLGHTVSQNCCPTCQDAWRFFGSRLHPWEGLTPREGPLVPAPEPGRFPPHVADVIVRAGWDGRAAAPAVRVPRTLRFIAEHLGPLDPAATDAAAAVFARSPFIAVATTGPGADCRRNAFSFGNTDLDAGLVPMTEAFGRRLGTPVFPVGHDYDCGGSAIVVAADGRLFLIDQAGDWHLGDSVDEALVLLVEGRLPRRLRADGALSAAP